VMFPLRNFPPADHHPAIWLSILTCPCCIQSWARFWSSTSSSVTVLFKICSILMTIQLCFFWGGPDDSEVNCEQIGSALGD
jgi:hypothetical protein